MNYIFITATYQKQLKSKNANCRLTHFVRPDFNHIISDINYLGPHTEQYYIVVHGIHYVC